ncbi:hypothetical protein [Collimonas humicola]|uniref:hypothetical protein n=1 Tax=Collimonas humicola TaxID=2825886 RepID=UPI001B8B92B0|nr:hypothetical protein [Collimonas humicola]
MSWKNKIAGILSFTLLNGCASFEPLKMQSNEERLAMFSGLSGSYRVIDSRWNNLKYTNVNLELADKRGMATVTFDNGETQRYVLSKCEVANKAQTANTGQPIEYVEDLVRCDVGSTTYQYAQVYVGKVKKGYTIKSQAVLGGFDPIVINSGYFINANFVGPRNTVMAASR